MKKDFQQYSLTKLIDDGAFYGSIYIGHVRFVCLYTS